MRWALGAQTAVGVHGTADVCLQGCARLQESARWHRQLWTPQGKQQASKALEAWIWAAP